MQLKWDGLWLGLSFIVFTGTGVPYKIVENKKH